MDARYVNAFLKSICNTFETMCGITVTNGKPALKKDDNPRTDVSGVIGFSGDASGAVILHLCFDTASKVASAFAHEDIDPEHPDFADAIGELVNMIAGGAKSQFEGLDISISLPSVVVGKDHNMPAMKQVPRIVVPCKIPGGEFHLEVGMVMNNAERQREQAAVAGATP